MLRELRKNKYAYSILIAGLGIGVLSFFAVWPHLFLQRVIIVVLSIFYFIWGASTHLKSVELTREIALEYFGVSIFGMVALLLLTI